MHPLRLPTVLVLLTVIGATGIGLLRARAALVINTNVASLEALQNLNETQAALQQSYERLSSGLRINTAADDAAGLAVSEKMRASVRSLGQASRNAQDGISLLQTAEGAYSDIGNILVRMRELAVQSANGGVLENNDREQLQTEYAQLVSEISRLTGTQQIKRGGLKTMKGTLTKKSAAKSAPELASAQRIFTQSLKNIRSEARQTSIDDFDDVVDEILRTTERSRTQIVAMMRQLLDALELQDQKAQELIRELETIQSENARWNESFASVTSSSTSSSSFSSSSFSSSSPLPSSSSSEVSKGHDTREMLPRSEKEQSSAAAFSSAKSVYSK